MGFLTGDYYTTFAGPGSFGHTGAGGSIAFAHPERELAFAYTMNRMSSGLAGYDRADTPDRRHPGRARPRDAAGSTQWARKIDFVSE